MKKEWTREELYHTYTADDKETLQQLHQQISKSEWRAQFHVQPVTGLMNDPNGFSYYRDRWHLYYQWFPYGAVHGMKHWYHVSSEDLVHWQNEGLAMKPDVLQDNYGCYSGSALIDDGRVYIAYTGNNRDYDWQRHPYQLLATVQPDGTIEKTGKPMIGEQAGYTEHLRDPKLFSVDGKYYILTGAQNTEGKGKLLLFSAESVSGEWNLLGELKVRGYDDFGYMVECPDIERIGDRWLLLFSPQGLAKQPGTLRNKFNNIYMTGMLDLENLEFVPDGPYRELDLGFDFYAAQCACQNQYPDKNVLIGWFGCSDYNYPPTDAEDWSGLQTMPRVLSLEDGKLMQRPAEAAAKLRQELLFEAKGGSIINDTMHGLMPETAIIRLDNPDRESVEFNLFTRPRKKGFEIRYDKNRHLLTIDREDMIHSVMPEFGTDRTVELENGLKSLEIYVDRSSVEIFVNDGEAVLSARIFPEKEENLIRMGGRNIDLSIWKPAKAAEDDFVI